MQCDEAALKVQALADNELTETEIPEVTAHVQSCYNCATTTSNCYGSSAE